MLNGAAPLAFAAKFLEDPHRLSGVRGGRGLPGAGRADLPALSDPASGRRSTTPMREASRSALIWRHTRADFVRAVMEGVALTFAEARDCLEAAGETIGDVGFSGGGARSVLWARMISAAIGRRSFITRGGETGRPMARRGWRASPRRASGRRRSASARNFRRHRARAAARRDFREEARPLPGALSALKAEFRK